MITYGPDADAPVPDLTSLDGVHAVRAQPAADRSAVYFDTPDLALLHHGVSLCRHTGGPDEGWHLELPVHRAPDELQRPLSRSAAVPVALRRAVAGWARGAALAPVATITTVRTPALLTGPQGVVLAEFTDDRVTGTTPDGGLVAWREWGLEVVDDCPELVESADRRLAAVGAHRVEASSKIGRILADRLPPRSRLPSPKAGDATSRLVHARLAQQLDRLARRDVDARSGGERGVHRMRVTTRRLRALLATARPVLDRDQTDPIREELRWLAGVLGAARDPAVVHARLRDLLAAEPRALVHGPVLRRMGTTYRGRGAPELRAALTSRRYFDLRDRLDRLLADPPWTDLADAAARDVVPRMLRTELKRFRSRARTAETADRPGDALHEARKAAKRLRYAAETVEPVAGKPARRLAHLAKRVTSELGELQDTRITRTELLALARAAAAAGEPTFTYGLLHAREDARARELVEAFDHRDIVDDLSDRTRKVRRVMVS